MDDSADSLLYDMESQIPDIPPRAVSTAPMCLHVFLHVLFFVVDAGTFAWQASVWNHGEMKFGWLFNYLTLCNLATHVVYWGFALVTDYLVYRDLRGRSHRWVVASTDMAGTDARRDPTSFLNRVLSPSAESAIRHRDRFFTLVWSVGLLVTLLYWLALFPADASKFGHNGNKTPLTLLEHGFTGVSLVVDIFVTRHRFSATRLEVPMAVAYGVLYLGWNMLCHYKNDVWAYPTLQGKFHPAIEVAIYAGAVLLLVANYFVGRWVANRFWWSEKPSSVRSVSGRSPTRANTHDDLFDSPHFEVEAPHKSILM